MVKAIKRRDNRIVGVGIEGKQFDGCVLHN